MYKSATLALEDGSIFKGVSIGCDMSTVGEVVFNTSMTGYQEILTDPSYAKQIVTLTYPHIGNVGTNEEDNESDRVFCSGLIIRDLAMMTSNWRNQMQLSSFLQTKHVTAIAEIDTRALTRILRDKGAQKGAIVVAGDNDSEAIEKARHASELKGTDLAKIVSTKQSYEWLEGSWQLGQGYVNYTSKERPFHVIVYDFGVKRNILRLLVDGGCHLTVVPAQTTAEEVLKLSPDGVFLSNGPGDPEACYYAIHAIKRFLQKKIPIFGICLGYQLLALASGAKTVKMKFGHHGANHPVQNLANKKVIISSQNHSFMVDENTLPRSLKVTHRSLFDHSLQGIEFHNLPAFGFQGHPEASPGPHDLLPLFNRFIHDIREYKKNSTNPLACGEINYAKKT